MGCCTGVSRGQLQSGMTRLSMALCEDRTLQVQKKIPSHNCERSAWVRLSPLGSMGQGREAMLPYQVRVPALGTITSGLDAAASTGLHPRHDADSTFVMYIRFTVVCDRRSSVEDGRLL